MATGANTLPQAVVEDAFRDQYGRTLNFRAFKDSLGKVNRWYEERGIFGQARPPCLPCRHKQTASLLRMVSSWSAGLNGTVIGSPQRMSRTAELCTHDTQLRIDHSELPGTCTVILLALRDYGMTSALLTASTGSHARQVTKVDMENGTVDLRFSEMIVNNLNLRFVDRKTGESREDGATRPDVILRQLTTRPGQVKTGPRSILD